MSNYTPPPVKPAPFRYTDNSPRNLPDLNNDEFESLTAVLKALARGGYPRLDAVPLALNAFNCNKRTDGTEDLEPWAHFHPVTIITPENARRREHQELELDVEILEDLTKPWRSIRDTHIRRGGAWVMQLGRDWTPQEHLARYRFICFIHKHRIDRRPSSQKGVHTISIWDREWDELTWHDTYHVDREVRRREIKQFWQEVSVPGIVVGAHREDFMSRIRYRTVYHICERIEDTIRATVPPRNTLWAVIGAALFHMNNVRDSQVSIVPDRLELFGAYGRGLIPSFFAHLLCLCLDARPAWNRRQQEAFVKQLRILDRLPWMRLYTRKHLELRDMDDGNGGGAGQGQSRDWVYGILKI
ncbi:hypothetical protein F5Y05DRAFT_423137 [Hypoxylon sp. FL0543]|nr:hypothetical protein F5Y05DRAFT_423137 [Hypoxylon sp. FL0543]